MRPAARPASTGTVDGLVSQSIAVRGRGLGELAAQGLSPGGREPSAAPSARPGALIRQRAHWPGFGSPGSLQTGELAQAGGGLQPAQSGPRLREVIGATRPQAEEAVVCRWQAGHQGRPVVREMPHGVAWPQTEHVSSGSVGQLERQGLRGPPLDPRRRRLPLQVSRYAGSVTRQWAHSGRPWSSRVAGSRRAPQWAHCRARECATQVRQTRTPSSGVSMRTTR